MPTACARTTVELCRGLLTLAAGGGSLQQAWDAMPYRLRQPHRPRPRPESGPTQLESQVAAKTGITKKCSVPDDRPPEGS